MKLLLIAIPLFAYGESFSSEPKILAEGANAQVSEDRSPAVNSPAVDSPCGEASQCAAPSTDQQVQLLHAPVELQVAGVTLAFESTPYLNLMPRMRSPNKKIDCTQEGRFIVPVLFNVSELPRDTVIENVWVHSSGSWWPGKFNANETRNENGRLMMTARGCPASGFRPGAFVDVIVDVRHEGNTQYLRTPARELGAAY